MQGVFEMTEMQGDVRDGGFEEKRRKNDNQENDLKIVTYGGQEDGGELRVD